MDITIIGLGPGDSSLMTCEARELLEKAKEVYLRTKRHPAVDSLPHHLQLHSFDHLYEEAETFEEVYERIAQEVLRLGERPEGVLYAVPGHPLVGEASVHRILALAQEKRIPVRIVAGMSFLEPVFSLLRVDPLDGLQIGDAATLASRLHPGLNPDTPALIGQLYSRTIASDLKLTLMNLYPDDHPVTLIQGAGIPEVKTRIIPLYELDHEEGTHPLSHLTSLFIPPLSAPSSFASLQDIVARLRAPDGCPWDREQTLQSLRPFLLEETYEALEALDLEDMERLREELGDLLLEVLLQVQIAAEGGEFKMPDVLRGIIAKLIRRHPHVFGEVEATTPGEVISHWQEIKREEGQLAEGPFADLPLIMPALARAQRIQQVAPARGLMADRDEAELLAEVKKGLEELRQLSATEEPVPSEIEAVWGGLLFDLVALANLKGVDAESALRKAVRDLERRLGFLEM